MYYLLYCCCEAMHANSMFSSHILFQYQKGGELGCSPRIPPIPSFVILCPALFKSMDEMNITMGHNDQNVEKAAFLNCVIGAVVLKRRQVSFGTTEAA
jgi:hypothetical protein